MKLKVLRITIMLTKYFAYGIFVQVLLMNLLLARNSSAQKAVSAKEVDISISKENTTVKDVFQAVERLTDFTVSFDKLELRNKLRQSITVADRNMKVSELLLEVSKQADLRFRQVNKVIHAKNMLQGSSFRNALTVEFLEDVDIAGIVTDENGQGLPGASLVLKGTTTGTTTGLDGGYKLSVPEDAIIVVSFVGYKTQEFPVNGRSTIDVQMDLDAEQLEEVVVIGYGAVKRSDLTGAVSSISSKDLENTASTNISSALQGRAAGVAVITGDGAPGGGINIRIRGTSSINSSTEPLYIVDGFPVNSSNDAVYVGGGINEGSGSQRVRPNALSFINPQDIESIEILKDAAATTIYGSRGANGVVLIKTKRGKSGQSKMDVNYSYGVQKVIKTYDRPTGPQYAERVNEGFRNAGDVDRFDGSSIYFPVPAQAGTTDWQDLLYRQAATQNVGVSFSGGTDQTQFLLSGKYIDQEGIIIESAFEDLQTRLNIDHQANDAVKVGGSVLLSHAIRNQVPTSGAVFNHNIIRDIISRSPVHNPEWIDESTGRYWTDPNVLYQTTDPYNLVTSTRDLLKTNRLLSNGYLDIAFAKNFNFHTTVGVDRTDIERDLYYPRTLQSSGSPINNGSASLNRTVLERKMLNAYVSYNKQLGENNISAVLGSEAITEVRKFRNMHSENFTSDAQTTFNMGEGLDNIRVGSGQTKWQNLGYFGRVNYNISGRYLLSANFRYDGASQFGKDNKWAFFPSVAAAWKISEESFFPSQGVMSNLKMRLSVGKTGNGFISPYSSKGTWSISGKRYSYNGGLVAGSRLTRMDNPELKWEATTQYNLGLDFGFMSDRLTFNVDFYQKNTNDLILNVVIPRSSGFGSSTQNIGALQNRGMELTMNWVVLDKDLKYDFSINGSHNKSKLTDLNIDDEERDTKYLQAAEWERYGGARLYEGQPAGELYGFIIDGTFENQAAADVAATQPGGNVAGYYNYRDTNDDGTINSDDMVSLGNGQPDFFLGMNHSFSYKNFDLSIFLQGAFGNQVAVFYGTDDFDYIVANTWTADDPVNKKYAINRVGGNGYQGLRLDNYSVHDADYLRLKNITLGYNLPVGNLNWTSGARIYFTAENMLTFSGYPGFNPDVSSGGTSAFGEGFDGGVYPIAKSYMIGVNFKF